jgi:hypothetical protein
MVADGQLFLKCDGQTLTLELVCLSSTMLTDTIIKGQNDQYDGADLFLTRTLFGDNIFILHVTMEFAKAMSIAWRLLQHLRFGLSLGWTQR